MLPRSQKLSVEQLNLVMEKGRITHSPLFIVRSMQADTAAEKNGQGGRGQQARISAVAPQKIYKKAVQRTKLRRQIYEAVRSIYPAVKPQTFTAIFAKAGVGQADFATLARGISEIFVKAGLLK